MVVDPDLPDHPKTLKLSRRLGLPVGTVVVLLLRMWGHCQTRRGELLGTDADDVAATCRWEGPAKKLLVALEDCRWIDRSESGWIAHGWAERNATWLSRIRGGKNRTAHAARDTAGRLQDATSPAHRQLAGSGAGGEEWSGEEKENPPLFRQRASEAESNTPEALISAKKRMCRMLRCPEQWEPDAEIALLRLLPTITEDDWRVVEWLYAQPPEGDGKRKRPMLKTRPRALTSDWAGAVATARNYLRDCGGSLEAEKKDAAPPDDWSEWLAHKGYAADVDWATVDESVRREYREERSAVA